jgi:hypothetical protein
MLMSAYDGWGEQQLKLGTEDVALIDANQSGRDALSNEVVRQLGK